MMHKFQFLKIMLLLWTQHKFCVGKLYFIFIELNMNEITRQKYP